MALKGKNSIKDRIHRAIIFSSGILVLIACIGFSSYEFLVFRSTATKQILSIAKLISINSASPLEFQDNKGAKELLYTLRAEPNIQSAVIYNKNNQVFANFSSPSNKLSFPQEPWNDGEYFKEGQLWVFYPIKFEEARLGTLLISSDLSQMYERLLIYGGIVLTIILLSLFIAFQYSSKLQDSVAQPVMELASTMQSVSKKKSYSLRADKKQDDEIGFLVDQFNDMITKIQSADMELKNSHNLLEKRVKERTSDLEKAQLEAESANHAKSLFLASMSHEIRTPLNAILGFSQLLQLATNINQKQRDHVENILMSGRHLLSLINDILDISKIEAGCMEVNNKEFSLDELISGISKIFRLRCQDKGLQWICNSPQNLQKDVVGDEGKIRQILINLIGNAIKFTESGSVLLEVTQDSDFYLFKVRDTGPGIPKDSLTEIFKPFKQNQLGLDKGGTGLGLAISFKQVELLGGNLRVESTEGKGTCFSFKIQLSEVKSPDTDEKISEPKIKPLENSHHLKALVVDDVKENREALCQMIRWMGVSVKEAQHGKEALEMISEDPPDVIFMDNQMPVMNGSEAIAEINKIYGSNRFKIVIVSASVLNNEREKFFSLGCSDFIGKPILMEKVYEYFKSLEAEKIPSEK